MVRLTEHCLGTPLKGKQSVQRTFALVRVRRTFSNPFDHFIAGVTRCVEFFNMSLCGTEPSLNTSLKGMQDEQGSCALVRDSSSTSNLLKPSRTTLLQR